MTKPQEGAQQSNDDEQCPPQPCKQRLAGWIIDAADMDITYFISDFM